MHIREYLDQHQMTFAEFGRLVGVTHATVSRWAGGKLVPRLNKILAIQTATGGAVTAESFSRHGGTMPRRRTSRAQKPVNSGEAA